MSRRIISVVCLCIALAAAAGAQAQSVSDADNAMHAMDMRMRALNTARKTLAQIGRYRDAQEADAVRVITDADVSVFSAAVKVFTVAFMITGMKCPDDIHFTQKQFGVVVNSFLSTADAELPRVNDSLPKLATPGALAQASSVHEAIVELRDFLRPFAIEN